MVVKTIVSEATPSWIHPGPTTDNCGTIALVSSAAAWEYNTTYLWQNLLLHTICFLFLYFNNKNLWVSTGHMAFYRVELQATLATRCGHVFECWSIVDECSRSPLKDK